MLKRLLKRSTAALLTVTVITSSLTVILSGCTKETNNTAKISTPTYVSIEDMEPAYEDTDLEKAGDKLSVLYTEFTNAVTKSDLDPIQKSAINLKNETQQLLSDFDSYAKEINNNIQSEDQVIRQRQADFEKAVISKANKTIEALDVIISAKDINGSVCQDAIDTVGSYFKVEKPKMLGAEMENNAVPVSSPEKEEVNDGEKYIKESVEAVGTYAPNKASLELSEETSLSDEIKTLADQLKTPLSVYQYVRNNIFTEFYYGSRKGAIATLEAKAGNDTDQASLLIAMLRYLGYNARYVSGTVFLTTDQALKLTCASNIEAAGSILVSSGKNVTAITQGGKITGVRLNQTWVEAYIPYTDYRGAANAGGEKRWIPLDPSIKEYERTDSIYDHLDRYVNSNELSSFSDEVAISVYNQVSEYLTSHPDETVNIRPWSIVPIKEDYLPLSLPYLVKNLDNEFDKLSLFQTDYVSFFVGGEQVASLKSIDLYNKRVILEYTPASESDKSAIESSGSIFNVPSYLVKVVPTLKIDGKEIGNGSEVFLGKTEALRIQVHSEGKITNIDNEITAGSIYQITQDLQSITSDEFVEASNQIKTISSETPIDEVYSDSFLGKMLDYSGKLYYAQVDISNMLFAEQMNVSVTRSLSLGMNSYEVQTKNMFGLPIGIAEGNFNVDIDLNHLAAVSRTGNKVDELSFMNATGLLSSDYEGEVIECLTGDDGISTISIFEEATRQGQDIITFDSDNISQINTKINADFDTLQDIQRAVNAGKIVAVHTDPITINDWDGFGYIITTPETGGSAYMISGGLNGGTSSWQVALSGMFGVLLNLGFAVELLTAGLGMVLGAGGVIAVVGVIGIVVLAGLLVAHCRLYIQKVWAYAYGDEEAGESLISEVIWDAVLTVGAGIIGRFFLKPLFEVLASAHIDRLVSKELANILKSGSKNLSELARSLKKAIKNGLDENTIKRIAEKSGEKGIRTSAKYGKKVGETIAKNGEKASDAINKCGEKGGAKSANEAADAINKHGNDATDLLNKHGKDALDTVYSKDKNAVKNAAKNIKDSETLQDINRGIGKNKELTTKEKVERLNDVHDNSGYKKDNLPPADEKYLKENGFKSNGDPDYDWPPYRGNNPNPRNPENALKEVSPDSTPPNTVYRNGNNKGHYGTDGYYSEPELGLPYKNNPEAQHKYSFNNDNNSYFDKIDSIRNDAKPDKLNQLIKKENSNAKEISQEKFDKIKKEYDDYYKSMKNDLSEFGIDPKYGSRGEATPMKDLPGGAPQFEFPLSFECMENLNILTEIP